MNDPLGLERCALCTNAFAYDADELATSRWQASGRRGFVCRWCAGTASEPDAARWAPTDDEP